jgi:uncharacterized coiled-coil protein SlyX
VTLDAASAEHQAALTSAEQRSKGDQLTSDDLKDAMTQHWRHISKARRELKLTVSAKKKATRPSNVPNVAKEVAGGCDGGPGGGGARFQGKCNRRGKEGHRATQCWEKDENADQRPASCRPEGSMNFMQ